ncbi:endoglucanase [Longicatena caecimuris]|uniref:Endoglucanase n=2 Tax=Longicatena caecimuris TaxID=1796635 RepID=A0A4R3TM51_9FIRM|nr:endoglucanase [Longicatena caecimuris]
MMNKTFMKELLTCISVSGKEKAIQQIIYEYMKDVCEDSRMDASKTLISVLNAKAKQKVLLCAHVDEIGFYVNRIYPDGTLGVIKAGGAHPILYLGTHVQIVGKELIHGVVICNKMLETKGTIVSDDLRIDIGCDTKEESEKVVSLGDVICAAVDMQELQKNRFAARAIDDRGGAFIILEAVRKAKKMGASVGMYAATTTGEETTRRGAFHAVKAVKPDCAIIVDVTFASDYQGVQNNEGGDIFLGKGAILCHSSIVNEAMNKRMETLAKQHGIAYQWEVTPGFTSTDGDTIHMSNEGVPICLVSLPLRYMHSSIETADWKDVESCIDLIAAFLCSLDSAFSYL